MRCFHSKRIIPLRWNICPYTQAIGCLSPPCRVSWLTAARIFNRQNDDSAVSPGTIVPPDSSYFSSLPAATGKDRSRPKAFNNQRRELGSLDNSESSIPQISRDPPSAPLSQVAPWISESANMPSTALLPPSRSFFDDGNDSLQPSPSIRPGTARTDASESMDSTWQGHRRPSEASATTISSQDSSRKGSQGRNTYHKKITNFFGDDNAGRNSKQFADATLVNPGPPLHRGRHNSLRTDYNDGLRAGSPTSSRPRTPLPSSDVVPWVFQDFKVCLNEMIKLRLGTAVLYHESSFKTLLELISALTYK